MLFRSRGLTSAETGDDIGKEALAVRAKAAVLDVVRNLRRFMCMKVTYEGFAAREPLLQQLNNRPPCVSGGYVVVHDARKIGGERLLFRPTEQPRDYLWPIFPPVSRMSSRTSCRKQFQR